MTINNLSKWGNPESSYKQSTVFYLAELIMIVAHPFIKDTISVSFDDLNRTSVPARKILPPLIYADRQQIESTTLKWYGSIEFEEGKGGRSNQNSAVFSATFTSFESSKNKASSYFKIAKSQPKTGLIVCLFYCLIELLSREDRPEFIAGLASLGDESERETVGRCGEPVSRLFLQSNLIESAPG
jgi:hypothetical protein